MTGMIEWGQNQNPPKIPRASNETQKNSLDQNLTLKKSHAEFPNHKNFQKALNDTTRKIETLVMARLCLFIHHTVSSENLVAIVTTLETPKKIFCYNNNIMHNDNSKQDHPGQEHYEQPNKVIYKLLLDK